MSDVVISLISVIVAIAAGFTIGKLAVGGALFLQWLADRIMERWWKE